MAKVVLEGIIDVPENDLEEVLNELPKHIELTRREEGCLVFRVDRDAENSSRFRVYEEFTSRQAFEVHQDRVRASRWGRVAVNVRRNYKVSEG
ncbi:putative quinol monooxygenase [Thiosocius teredinicola]|uniref:putative quinol monooxygenase n=1 Tax=Thiosocius teredinicola TaxID=1973002 RepID=UPI0009910D4B